MRAAALSCLLFLLLAPGGEAARRPTPLERSSGALAEVERLAGEQKLEAALQKTKEVLTGAREAGDEQLVAEALIKATQLEMGLHGYETAVRFLKQEAWPKNPSAQVLLNLFYGRSLMNYQNSYSWEINSREKTVSSGAVDLKSWTTEQIGREISRSFDAAMTSGAGALDGPLPGWFRAYVSPNNYPQGVRPTLRDAVTYLTVRHFQNTQFWSPKESNERYKLGTAKLAGEPAAARIPAASEQAHPIEKLVSWLGDLERAHAKAGRKEASFEARYERLQALHGLFTEADDRKIVRDALRAFQKKAERLPWWARGQAHLAEQIRAEDRAGKLIDARAEAIAGRDALPNTPGAMMCAAIVAQIESPELGLAAMVSDAPAKRSVLLTYRNVRKAWFRAYPLDVEKALGAASGEGLLTIDSAKMNERLASGEKPAAAWSEELAETRDYLSHRHFATPPQLPPGLYLVVASMREGFGPTDNVVHGATSIVGDLVLTSRSLQDGTIEVRTLSGASGKAVGNVRVKLFRFDWRTPPLETAAVTTNSDGTAIVREPPAGLNYGSYFFLARNGAELALERQNVYFPHQGNPGRVTNAFVYTDRSIYRPQQKIQFKVVAYQGDPVAARYETAREGEQLEVRLMDPNYQQAGIAKITLGKFGSGSGEFTVPAGRPLGHWTIQTAPTGGSASVKVEEYKRPTFEAQLKEAAEPYRLNRKAKIAGEARYYFGLPVTAGSARWRVTRTEVAPWWWGFWGWWRGGRRNAQNVASGTAEIGKDGGFSFEFLPEADERKGKKAGVSYNFDVNVDVTDEGGETRTATRTFRLGFVAVEARFDWDEGFFLPGRGAELRARLTDLDGKARKGEGEFRIARLAAPATPLPAELPRDEVGDLPEQETAPDGKFAHPDDAKRARWETQYRWESVTRAWKEAETVQEGRVEHDEKGDARIAAKAFAKAGVYRLTYRTKDSFGAAFEASRDFLVAGEGVNLPLVVAVQDGTREPGQNAKVFVHSGLKGQPLLLEVFRAGQRIRRQAMEGGNPVVELPVGADDRGGFTVVVSGLRDHQPLVGTADVAVPWNDRKLALEFSTFRDKLRPGQKEMFRISVKGDKGKALEPGSAEVLAYMYDRSLDFFGPHAFPGADVLYPVRTGGSFPQYTLGAAQTWTLASSINTWHNSPSFQGEELQVYASYGVGGPGHRGGRHRGMMLQEAGFAMDSAGAPGGAAMAKTAGLAAPMAASRAVVSDEAGAMAQNQATSSEPVAAPHVEAAAPAVIRSNFSETAFFAPNLVLDGQGGAAIEFTTPDSVTSWNVLAHALTRDLRGGSVKKETRSVKELMVRPYAPRFLREGDVAEIRVQVNNAGEASLAGELTFEIEGEEGRSALGDFALEGAAKKSFKVEKGGSVTLAFPVKAPRKVGDYSFRVTARAGAHSDGERRPFPVLPSRLHLAQSRFVSLHHNDAKTLEFKDMAAVGDPSLTHEKLVVTVDAQLFYGVLNALPYLVKYPYECVEQTLNRFLSTGIVSSLFGKYPSVAKMAKEFSARKTQLERFDEPDANRRMQLEESPWLQEAQGGAAKDDTLVNVLDPETAAAEKARALAKLQKAQLPNGAFPWFEGGQPDEYMTTYILMSLTRAVEFKVDVPKDMVARAWSYVRSWLDQHLSDMLLHDTGWETVTMINFALSGYPDASWTGNAFDEAYRRKLLDFSFKHWKDHSPLLKGYLALTLHRMQRDPDAKLVWDAVMDSAKHDEQLGTYWAREDRSWLWYNDEIDTQAFALRTQMELRREDKRNEGLVQWLFLNKKLNHWKSTRATAEVIYALTHYLDQTSQLGVAEDVKVKVGPQTTEFHFDPEKYTGKKNQIVIPGEKVDAKAMSRIEIAKPTPGFAFASATWHFATDKLPEEDRGDFFQVSRRYFRREHAGAEWRLVPLAEGAKIAVGDELEVQLSLRTKHEAEYVHLRDPRGAGFEPEHVNSGWRWDYGVGWYEETRDSASNFFFSRLPVGEYTFKYRVRANMAGTFRVGPAEVQSLYAPEFNAYSAGHVLRVEP